MAQTHEGAMKVLARKANVSLDELTARHRTGEKWCYKCKSWKLKSNFSVDRSRWDGLTSTCRVCRSTRKSTGPSTHERREKELLGKAWCRGCMNWLQISEVYNGSCRPHLAKYERDRYANDSRYRASRRHRSAQRKRNVAPIPVEAQETLTEQFGGECAYCSNQATSFDHIEAVSRGGQTLPGFIVPSCVSCNSRKKNKTLDEFIQRYSVNVKHELIDVLSLQFI